MSTGCPGRAVGAWARAVTAPTLDGDQISAHTRPIRCRAWTSASSPSLSRARRTTTCSASPAPPGTAASRRSSARTTCWRWASTPGLPGPSDSYVTLAALAAQVPDIRLGTLVTSATFRHPSMLAIAVARHRRHLRWPGRARPWVGMVRGGAPGLRARLRGELRRTIRPADRAVGDHHRAVGNPGRRQLLLRRSALPAGRLPRDCRSRFRPAGPAPPACRSSSAATVRSGPRRWPPGSPTSSTSGFSDLEVTTTPTAPGPGGLRGGRTRSR